MILSLSLLAMEANPLDQALLCWLRIFPIQNHNKRLHSELNAWYNTRYAICLVCTDHEGEVTLRVCYHVPCSAVWL